MAHTNSTPNYNLPQFVGTDKPTWLGDVNGAMLAIDTAVATVSAKADASDAKADGAVTTANSAASTASDAAPLANTANTNATSALTTAGNAATAASAAQSTADGAVTTANAASTKADTVAADVGDLEDLTTTVKTDLVAAINEVNGKATPDAGDIDYDNTTSGLTAANVQDAIDELAGASPSGGVTVIDITNRTITSSVFEITNDIPSGKLPFAFILTSATTSQSHYGVIWKNQVSGVWNVTLLNWADGARATSDTNVNGKLLCI